MSQQQHQQQPAAGHSLLQATPSHAPGQQRHSLQQPRRLHAAAWQQAGLALAVAAAQQQQRRRHQACLLLQPAALA
jgi:hypothetical protein